MTLLPVDTANDRPVAHSTELSHTEISAAVRRYQAGQGIEPLARSMGLGSRTMRRVLVDAGVVIRSSGKPWPRARGRAETARDADALYQAGNTVHGVARKLGIPYATIRLLLAEQGVQFRQRSARPHREA
jgi:DNA-binding transcriptional regulator LsrR (DeoR family)